MNYAKSEGAFERSALEAEEKLESLLHDFDRFFPDLDGDPETHSAGRFKSVPESEAQGLVEHPGILSAIFEISGIFDMLIFRHEDCPLRRQTAFFSIEGDKSMMGGKTLDYACSRLPGP